MIFNEEQRQNYKSIKAPDALKASVMNDVSAKSSRHSYKRYVAVAACLVVALVSAFVPHFGSDAPIAHQARRYALAEMPYSVAEFPHLSGNALTAVLDFAVEGEAVISVDCGMVCLQGGASQASQLKIDGNAQITWIIREPQQTEAYTLTVKIGQKSYSSRLEFDSLQQSWLIESN